MTATTTAPVTIPRPWGIDTPARWWPMDLLPDGHQQPVLILRANGTLQVDRMTRRTYDQQGSPSQWAVGWCPTRKAVELLTAATPPDQVPPHRLAPPFPRRVVRALEVLALADRPGRRVHVTYGTAPGSDTLIEDPIAAVLCEQGLAREADGELFITDEGRWLLPQLPPSTDSDQ